MRCRLMSDSAKIYGDNFFFLGERAFKKLFPFSLSELRVLKILELN